jgi:hypothetical protein
MANNSFPPQAYTRDVLSHAYEWLRTQPVSIREMAKDADSLVALYFQSRRRPAEAPTLTPSSQSFKNDLKVLAEGIKQFEDTKPVVGDIKTVDFKNDEVKMPEFKSSAAKTFEKNTLDIHSLDQKSLELVRTVQTRLNLSQESEALRMIIAMGYDRIREILPK